MKLDRCYAGAGEALRLKFFLQFFQAIPMLYDSDQLSLLDVLLDASLHTPLPLNLARVTQDPSPALWKSVKYWWQRLYQQHCASTQRAGTYDEQ
jgi:hypothetical protein